VEQQLFFHLLLLAGWVKKEEQNTKVRSKRQPKT
jgi:hypothetical protein